MAYRVYRNYEIRYRAKADCYDVFAPHSDCIATMVGLTSEDAAKGWIDTELLRIAEANSADDREYD